MKRIYCALLTVSILICSGCVCSQSASDVDAPAGLYAGAVQRSFGGRFDIVSGFQNHTGIVVDKETGVEYFATLDKDYNLYIGSAVEKKKASASEK